MIELKREEKAKATGDTNLAEVVLHGPTQEQLAPSFVLKSSTSKYTA